MEQDLETMNSIDDKAEIVFNKEMLIIVPVLGSALAIIYDVGFFTGLGTSLFTLFSLSEHILFALEVLPLGLLMATALGITASYDAEKPIGRLLREKWPVAERLALPLLCLLVAMLLFVLVYFKLYYFSIAVLVGSGFLVAALRSTGITRRGLYIVLGVTVLTFSIGHDNARLSLQPIRSSTTTTTIQTRAEPTIQARIIRTGDRGILFYNPVEKQITLLRWDEITKINLSH
jgi:hypothetical protein